MATQGTVSTDSPPTRGIPIPQKTTPYCLRCGQIRSGQLRGGPSFHFCAFDFSETLKKAGRAGDPKKSTPALGSSVD
ncbi:hypothetical protein F4678DRAFT_445930 [Xylaria arbuscula]|nr:hypothetical protein F4678DRAFT_445930 [Xylaria arbuscula]